MKITTIQDVDLSQYKLAYFTWNSMDDFTLCQDDVMKMADAWIWHTSYGGTKLLQIALIPLDKRLQDCWWDDWNDVCARDNASWFYTYPEWTLFLEWHLWWELKICGERRKK